MTREEAVARIKDHIEIHRYHERNAVKILEALDMAIKALEQPEQRWIPCTDPTKLPKNKVLWITCEICGCRVLKEIYWDMTEWSDDVSGLIAYMPYVEPAPYRKEGD